MPAAAPPAPPPASPGFRALPFGALFLLLGVEAVMFGAAAPRIQADFGLSNLQLSLSPATAVVGVWVGALAGGAMSQPGRERIQILVAALAAAGGLAAMAAAPYWAIFVAANFFATAALCASLAVGHGVIGAIPDRAKRERYISVTESAYGLGLLIGPQLVALILATIGLWRAAYLTLSAAFLIMAFAAWRMPRPPAAAEPMPGFAAYRTALARPMVRGLVLCGFCLGALEMGHISWAVIAGQRIAGISEEAGRIGLTLFGCGMLASRLALAPLAGAVGAGRLHVCAALGGTLGAAATLTATGEAQFWAANLGMGLGMGLAFPTALLAAMERAPKLGGVLSGLLTFGAGAGMQASVLGIGAISDAAGMSAAYGLIVVVGAAWIAIALWYWAALRAEAARA